MGAVVLHRQTVFRACQVYPQRSAEGVHEDVARFKGRQGGASEQQSEPGFGRRIGTDPGQLECAPEQRKPCHGAFLLGEMAALTANAGKIYFPAGTPDPSDRSGDTLDPARSVTRGVAAGTGLPASPC